MAKKIADQLVETLVEAGVKRIYAVTGDSLNEVNDAVRRHGDDIQWIHVRHEESGAFAAGAEAQLTGKLTCCAGSSGPGHVHLINGVYDAHRSGAPVLVIASTIISHEFGTQYFQETNTIKLFDDCSYYNQLPVTRYEFPRMLQGAMQAAVSSRGVAVIGLPGDLAAADAMEVPTAQFPFPTRQEIIPSEKEIAAMAAILNKADKVTLYCGIGAAKAHAEVRMLSDRLKAPVAYSFKGKMEIQYDMPNEVGMNGLLGMPSGYSSLHEADVVLLLGTDFPYENFMPENNTIIQVDINPDRIGRRAKVDLGICGDVKSTLSVLLPRLEQKTGDTFLEKQKGHYEEVKKVLATYTRHRGSATKIHPEYVMAMVNEAAARDAIFTVDTGMTCVWGARYLEATGQRKMLGSFNHGSMANAMPQAIGAALAFPERQVIALCGDGGISMLLGDLATIVQYKLPIKIIVFNNRALGMVKLEMEVAGLPDWQTDMYNPDFAKVAQAMGMEGYTVNEPDELVPVLIRTLETNRPVLIDVMTDPDALAMPPHIEFGQMKGFAEAMYKLLLQGRGKDVVNTINSNYRHIAEVF